MSEKVVLNKKLAIDNDDRKIMSLLQANPNLTHSEIADKINKSQPAVGARILKLERKGLQTTQYGINLKENKFALAIVSMHARHPKQLLDMITCCPFFINAFKTSGRTNIMVWLVGSKLEKIEEIVEKHFRTHPDISRVSMAVVMEPIKTLVLPVDFNFEHHNTIECGQDCHDVTMNHVLKGREYVAVEGGSELNGIFGIDDDDKRIVTYLQLDPEITHSSIGERIGKSQPAVGARITKMKDKKFLAVQKGVNFKLVDQFHIVQVSIAALNTQKIMERMAACPFTLTGFRTTGDASLVVYIAGHSLELIDEIIDFCIRSDDHVKEIETQIVLKYMHDLVLPYNFDCEFIDGVGCLDCKHCTSSISRSAVLAATRDKA